MSEIIINQKVFKQYDDTYYISADGDVYSTYSKKCLKHDIDLYGYPRVDIHGKHMKVHKLVFLTWIGELSDDLQINHLDDNKLNCNYKNLYAGTQKQNIQDCINNGTRCGNIHYLTIYDKEKEKILTFCPAKKFIQYSGHSAANDSVKRMFTRHWFKKRYQIIEYGKISNNNELKSVTTMGDECNPVE